MQCRYTNLRHSHYGSANLQTASSPPSSPSLPPPQQTESESTSYHWMREMNTSAHTIILRENAGFKSAVLPRLVGFEGIISFSLPPNPVFSPFLLVADGSVPCFNFFFFFWQWFSPLPTRSRQWDDTLLPAAGINMQGGRNQICTSPLQI